MSILSDRSNRPPASTVNPYPKNFSRLNRLVEEHGLQPHPLGITPHKLRHTFASILVAYVMQQLGHTDPAFTLQVYSHTMRRSAGTRERLRALVEGHVWAVNGQYGCDSAS